MLWPSRRAAPISFDLSLDFMVYKDLYVSLSRHGLIINPHTLEDNSHSLGCSSSNVAFA